MGDRLAPAERAAAIATAIDSVRARLDSAGGTDVALIGVAKTFPAEAVDAAIDAGLIDIGESYAQELAAKVEHFAASPPANAPRWHFVGQLQRNKVRRIAGAVHLWHSVDRSSLIAEIAKRAPGAAVLIQVNTTDEPQKAGCGVADAPALVERAMELGLDVRGLMTIGRQGPPAQSAPAFATLRALADQLDLVECSMGMTADLEVAVAEGATMVRVGRDIFGERPSGER